MTQTIKIQSHPDWQRLDTQDGALTLVRGEGRDASALQASRAQFKASNLPNANEAMLVGICEKMAGNVQGVREKSSNSGVCAFGLFGTLTVRGQEPDYLQLWVLSNGRDFILVTHTCNKEPEPTEIHEAHEIALSVRLDDTI